MNRGVTVFGDLEKTSRRGNSLAGFMKNGQEFGRLNKMVKNVPGRGSSGTSYGDVKKQQLRVAGAQQWERV